MRMKFDYIIMHLGQFGTYQKRLYFAMCVPMMVVCAFHKLMWVFIGASPPHRCKITYDDELNSSYQYQITSYLNETIPWDNKKNTYSSCLVYDDIAANVTKSCESWIYDNTQYYSTVVSDFNLVCSNDWLVALVPSLQMTGEFVGSILWGLISDRFGRMKVFVASIFLLSASGVICSFSTSYLMLIICRGIIGFSTPGVVFSSYILMMEFVGPSKRVIAGITSQYFFALAYFIIAGSAYFLPNWRHLQIALSVPGFIMVTYCWFVPESVRWLLAENKPNEAMKIIKKVANINKVHLSEDITIEDIASEKPSGNLFDLIRHRKLRIRALNIMYCWFVNTCIYYGLSLNTSNLGGNNYLNFAISGAVEIPSYTVCWLFLNRFGRRKLISFGLILSGLSLFSIMFVPKDLTSLIITLAMFGKFSANISYATIYMYTTELFPTTIRTSAFGLCSTCGRVGAIVSPFFIYLANYWNSLPLLAFSILSATSGSFAYFLPETLNKNLPDTIEEGINLCGSKDINTHNCNNHNNSDVVKITKANNDSYALQNDFIPANLKFIDSDQSS